MKLQHLWREYGVPMALYALLTVAITWPAVRDFSGKLVSDGGDARNNLWMIWHVKEALLGQQPAFDLPLLYYPAGVNLLSRGLGPVVGLLALPFWPLGAEAAYNGSMLVGFWLTGAFMYMLGRGLGFSRPVAFFAGLMLLAAPIHLVGILGHMTKTFLGLLPLALLALHHALDRRRSLWWALAAAVVLFFTLFHNGYQFLFVVLAFAFFTLTRLFMAGAEERRAVLRRGALTTIVVVALVGPFTLLFLQASQNPLVSVDANVESFGFQPDLVELFVPPKFSLLLGSQTSHFLVEHEIESNIETNVFLSWTGLFLSIVAFTRCSRRARPWLLFATLCVLLALGPSLKWLGQLTFTEYDLNVLMPYALLTALPGFDFMRAPARFMMIGSVAFAVSASFGLAWLVRRFPRRAMLISMAAMVLVLIEVWPRPWPQETLRPVPEFYLQIAADEELYGVFDLPVKPTRGAWFASYASYYQRYQMAHEKGIASGYLARTYTIHPLFPCVIPEIKLPHDDVLVDGEPADCTANFLHDLAFYNYRYVVHHKTNLDGPASPSLWGRVQAGYLIDNTFGDQRPVVDDALVTVYAVPELSEAVGESSPTIGLTDNWYSAEGDDNKRRWARSPATLFLSVPRAQVVTLELTTGLMFGPRPELDQVLASSGRLSVALNGEHVDTIRIVKDSTAVIPLELPAGVHSLTLSLEAGNFRPVDYGMGDDRRLLSFMMQSINLRTE